MAFVRWVLRHRALVAVLVLLSLAVSVWSARRVQVRFQYRDFYAYPSNPRLPLFDRLISEFGDPGGAVAVLVEAPDVFQPETLRYIDAVTRGLQPLPEFSSVRSLTNVPVARAVGDGVDTGPLLTQIPATSEEIERVRSTALGSALLVKRLVAQDGTMTAVLARPRKTLATIEDQDAAIAVARQVVDRLPAPEHVRVRVTGAPTVEVGTTHALTRDMMTLTPCATLVMILGLALAFRSVQGVLLPLAAVFVSLVWTAGLFAILGRPVDLVMSLVPTIIIVYGMVDPIFVYTRYLGKLPAARSREDAVVAALSELFLPCLLTSVTTALGFAVFMTATLPTIRTFGLVVAIGVLLAFVTTVTILPLLLVSVPVSTAEGKPHWLAQKIDAQFERLWDRIRGRRVAILAAVVGFIIVGGVAASGIRIVSTYVDSLPRGAEQRAIRDMEAKLSGVVRVAVYLDGPAGAMKTPEALRAMDSVERLAERDEIVTSAVSVADVVAELHRAFEGGAAEQRIPDSPRLIAQYLSVVDPADGADFVNAQFSHACITLLLRDRGSPSVWRLRDQVQAEANRRFLPLGIVPTVTGFTVAYQELDEMVREVLWGFVYAFAIIVLLEWAAFRSLRVALVSVVPNLVPVAACFLAMRYMGLDLRIETSLVLCVSVGGLFNTTIHVAARILQQRRAGAADPDAIIRNALRAVGPPSLYTAAGLSAGFAVICISNFVALRALGVLCAVTFLSAFLADAVVTPSLMRVLLRAPQDEGASTPEVPVAGAQGA